MAYRTSLTQNTQNDLLMKNLMVFYNNQEYLMKMIRIINGESKISLRIIDWFVTNFAKQNYTVYGLTRDASIGKQMLYGIEKEVQRETENTILSETEKETGKKTECVQRFKVYNDYKLRLKAYSKERFDPFCRWDRISIPYDNDNYMETTIGQLNFFKWAIENCVIEYIEFHFADIEADMNMRNSTSKRKSAIDGQDNSKTRKKREELSISACKCIKKENVNIIVTFGI